MPVELHFAAPPSWTVDAPCQHEWPQPAGRAHRSPFDADHLSAEKAAELCAGCPILETCLAEAMLEEGDLVARNRYGVRGGMGSQQRADLAVTQRECPYGHVGHMAPSTHTNGRPYLRCLECNRSRSRERWESSDFRHKRSAAVCCVECRKQVRASSLARHINLVHKVRTEEAA